MNAPPQNKAHNMTKLISALMRTFAVPSDGPTVHFHQSSSVSLPEACHDRACQRPQLDPAPHGLL